MSEKKDWTVGVKSVFKKVLIFGLFGVGTLAITASATSLFDGLTTMNLSWGQTILSSLGIIAGTTALVAGGKAIRENDDKKTAQTVKTIKKNADEAVEVIMEPYREEEKNLVADIAELEILENSLKEKKEKTIEGSEVIEETVGIMLAIAGAGSDSIKNLTNDYSIVTQPDIDAMKTK